VGNSTNLKHIKDYQKNDVHFNKFLAGMDKKCQKNLIAAFKTGEVEDEEVIIHSGQMEPYLLFLCSGTLIVSKDEGEDEILEKGAIIGLDQFLFNKPWPYDVYCKEQASISRYKYDSY